MSLTVYMYVYTHICLYVICIHTYICIYLYMYTHKIEALDLRKSKSWYIIRVGKKKEKRKLCADHKALF